VIDFERKSTANFVEIMTALKIIGGMKTASEMRQFLEAASD